jgi:hypothetical protein
MTKTFDTCGTFLDTRAMLRRLAPVTTSGSPAKRMGAVSPAGLRLLECSFPVTVPRLLARTKLGVYDFADALSRLQQAGLIEVEEGPGRQQVVLLTEHGALLINP